MKENDTASDIGPGEDSQARRALEYHARGRKGKIEVRPTKPTRTQDDLSLAYSPGVAVPCLEIEKNPESSFEYTARGNLVAVISNGTAVLGLGDIGAEASKPVMEGKGVLFKRFADIDVFDLEVDEKDPGRFIDVVKAVAPGFGGINLEDIKAPECYVIEETLKKELDIPVFHDDQHGTAIIASAALLNALDLVEKDIGEIRVVISGAGAAAISCGRLFVSLGVDRAKVIVTDSRGVIHAGRLADLTEQKKEFAAETDARTLEEALVGADVFLGLSKGGLVSPAIIETMADRPIIFALANPDPEIGYAEAREARPDSIVGTGRSDFPNQINNVLGFPFIFRGALDVRAREINEAMKLAAVRALADLAREDVPLDVSQVYGNRPFTFGPEYVIPKPFDRRALVRVSSAVARAAMESGVARHQVDIAEYEERLENLLGRSGKMVRAIYSRARTGRHCRIVLPEGEEELIQRAARRIVQEGLARPVLLGNADRIQARLEQMVDASVRKEIEVIDPLQDERLASYAERLYELRKFKGLRREAAGDLVRDPMYFGTMMVKQGDAEGFLAGISHTYAQTIRPALEIIRVKDWLTRVSGLYIITVGENAYFFADTTVNIDPSPSELAEIAICAAETARHFGADPRVAMISFSNNGSSSHPRAQKVREALRIARERFPDLCIDGEMQADVAVSAATREQVFPMSALPRDANVLIFPDIDSANAAYKLMMSIGKAEGFGPIIMGIRKPINVLAQGCTVEDIVNMAGITAIEAQSDSFIV